MVKRNFYYKREVQQKNLIRIVGICPAPEISQQFGWDFSGAVHIRAGESVIEVAIRELKVELGIEANENDLRFIDIVKSTKILKTKNLDMFIY